MFSFRTTPLEDLLDKSLLYGSVGVFYAQSSWNATTGRYSYEIFQERRNLGRTFTPKDGHFDFSQEDLEELNAVVVDLQDVGCRHFPYTRDIMRLLLFRSRMEEGPGIYIVDRPNPLGRLVEGTMPTTFETQLWTAPVPVRHGLTLGELCYLYQKETGATFPLHVISAEVASKELMPWAIPPSDNLPGLFSLPLYCGGGLWKGSAISEGLGTNRPYEYLGAPFVNNEAKDVPCPDSAFMRPCTFTPLSGIYAGQLCSGWQILLRPGVPYHSYMHTLQLMRWFCEHYSQFEITDEIFSKVADPVVEEYLKGGITFDIAAEHIKLEEQKWIRKAKRFCLYEDLPYRIK